MQILKNLFSSAMVIACIAMFNFTGKDAHASECFRDLDQEINFGNGICDAGEDASECVNLGRFVLEICPSADKPFKQFPRSSTCGEGKETCSEWSYILSRKNHWKGEEEEENKSYQGHHNHGNNISFLIPNSVEILSKPNGAKIFTDGKGDPKTGFGKFDKANNVLRIPFHHHNPSVRYITFKTSTAAPGEIPTLLKIGRKKSSLIQGPADGEIPQISSTSEQITTGDGITLDVKTDQLGNLVSAEASNGKERVLSLNDLFLCVPKAGISDPYFPDDYECERVAFLTDRATIKVEGEDPCYSVGGRAICY